MLLDTSGLLSLFDRSATSHLESVRLYRAAPRLLIHNYALAEFIPLCHVRRMPRPESIEFVRDLLRHPRVEMVWVGARLHEGAMDLLTEWLDKTYSLCDALRAYFRTVAHSVSIA